MPQPSKALTYHRCRQCRRLVRPGQKAGKINMYSDLWLCGRCYNAKMAGMVVRLVA